MQVHIETTDPAGFIKHYKDAFDALVRVAERGSDEEHAAAAEIAPYRDFFLDAPPADQAALLLKSWSDLSLRERALADGNGRWDIQNVLYMLGPGMRTWRHDGMEIVGPSSVILKIEEIEHPSATGVIRQIVECAGGQIVKEESRAGWLSSFLERMR